MKSERHAQILSSGFNAAREQMEQQPGRPEYPHDYNRLYQWLEEKLFNLFEAIRRKQYKHIRDMSGEIIITASEIAELTEPLLSGPKTPESPEKEVP